jgi:hypothetical protein
VLETPEELERLQTLLDESIEGAGRHLRDVIDDGRRMTAEDVCARMHGMCLLVVGTVTADGRPLVGPVDGYLVHGSLWFSSARDSVRMRHLARRPHVSATYLPSEECAVTVHGHAELFDVCDPQHPELRDAMLRHYLPLQGPAFAEWVDRENPVGARIETEKIFTFLIPR